MVAMSVFKNASTNKDIGIDTNYTKVVVIKKAQAGTATCLAFR